jgi:RNA polymerase sigma factor (sigma-70 family)
VHIFFAKILERSGISERIVLKGCVFMAETNVFDELIPTRKSLLSRLKNWGDQDGWKVFFDTYWRLIYRAGRKAGLSDAEAQDAVQETLLSVCKSMPDFKYNQEGSFKGWLLKLTSWRIMDQLRKRQKHLKNCGTRTSTGTDEIEAVPDTEISLDAAWNEEWEQNLMQVAIERVKRKVDGKHFQVFELSAVKGWPVARICKALKINRATIYLAKHRISKLIKQEVTFLKTKPI